MGCASTQEHPKPVQPFGPKLRNSPEGRRGRPHLPQTPQYPGESGVPYLSQRSSGFALWVKPQGPLSLGEHLIPPPGCVRVTGLRLPLSASTCVYRAKPILFQLRPQTRHTNTRHRSVMYVVCLPGFPQEIPVEILPHAEWEEQICPLSTVKVCY